MIELLAFTSLNKHKWLVYIFSLLVSCIGTSILLFLAAVIVRISTGHYVITDLLENPGLCLFVKIVSIVLIWVIASNFRKQVINEKLLKMMIYK
jgi:hypothetical protein